MEESAFDLKDFSLEMGEYEVRKVKKFDRVWRIGEGGSIASSPVARGGMIYFGCCDRNVYCLDAKTGRLVWKFRTEGAIMDGPSPVHGGLLYIGSYDHSMYALHAATGRLAWKFMTEGEIASTPVQDNGMVYFGSRDRNIYALDAKTGSLAWKFRTSDGIISEPRVWKDRLIIGSYDHFLYCLEKKTGRLLWKFATQGEIQNSNAFGTRDGVVYFGSFDNFLRAVNIGTGRLLWKTRTGSYGMGVGPVIYKDMILQQTRDGILFCLDLNGRILWKSGPGNNVQGPPLVHGDMIYFGSFDHNMYCVGLDGREMWRFRMQAGAYGRPVVSGGMIYVPSFDCNLYAVNLGTRELAWKFRTSGNPSPGPPPYESFEVRMKVSAAPAAEEKKKAYELEFSGDEAQQGGLYRPRVTYQMKTHYASKGGKYQVNTDEEGL
jgi:outer membrane protein assembly factor BamB